MKALPLMVMTQTGLRDCPPATSGPIRTRSRGRRRLLWRPCPTRLVDRAHQTDVVAVGVGHDGVARSPESIEGGLPPGVAGAGEVGVAVVDGLPARKGEADHDARSSGVGAPARVPQSRRLRRVELEAEAARHRQL